MGLGGTFLDADWHRPRPENRHPLGCFNPCGLEIGCCRPLLCAEPFEVGKINHVYWSLAVEMQIYLVFPVIVWLFCRQQWATSLGLLFLSAVLNRMAGSGFWGQMQFPLYGVFAVGMLSAYLSNVGMSSWLRTLCHILIVSSACYFLLISLGWSEPRKGNVVQLDYLLGVATCAVLALGQDSVYARLLSIRPLQWIGIFSYSLYLVHAPLLQVVWQVLVKPQMSGSQAFLITAGAGLIVSLMVARLFFQIFERPLVPKPGQNPERVFEAQPKTAAQST